MPSTAFLHQTDMYLLPIKWRFGGIKGTIEAGVGNSMGNFMVVLDNDAIHLYSTTEDVLNTAPTRLSSYPIADHLDHVPLYAYISPLSKQSNHSTRSLHVAVQSSQGVQTLPFDLTLNKIGGKYVDPSMFLMPADVCRHEKRIEDSVLAPWY
jgi:hypothetical protein